MKKRIVEFFIIAGLLISAFAQTVISQPENIFKTYTGGFSINLPQKDGGGGNGTAGGIYFTWRQPEAEYEVGFYEIEGLPLAKVDGKFSFEEMVKQHFNKFSAKGERIYGKEIALRENAGREYKYKTAASVFILRLYIVSDRIYKLLAQIPLKNQSQEEKVLQAFDSFQLLDQTIVKAAMAKKLADATPKELPQSPVVAKLKSDLQDRNLKGAVKSILTETALYGLKDSLKKPKPQMLEEFDRNGRILKQIEFDSFGNPHNVSVYGYVAKKRVASVGSVTYEYSLGGMAIEFPQSAKFDNRFSESYDYRYAGDNLIEERTSWSNGFLYRRSVYRYLKGKREAFFYDGGTVPHQKIVSTFDNKGNETETVHYQYQGRKSVEDGKYKIEYGSFDEKGNWTKRMIYKQFEFEGNEKSFPESVEYRTISYYE